MFKNIKPLISIVTVVRNGREFVEDTIVSVLSQTYENYEYIVIDGASQDGTVDVIASYSEKIKYWISEKDAGIADAFNKGYNATTGDYIIFLNADDYFVDSNVLQDVVNLIQSNNYPILVYGDCEVHERVGGNFLYRTNIQLTIGRMKRGGMLPQPSLFSHRSYFEKYGLFDLKFKIAMDYEWLLRGARNEIIVHIFRCISCVRNGGVSTTNQKAVITEIIRALRKNNYFRFAFGGWLLLIYFMVRMYVKDFLIILGWYDKFNVWRFSISSRK